MPLKLTLPPDLDRRLIGLGDAIAASSADVLFAYVFGSAARGSLTPGSDVDVAIWSEHCSDREGTLLVPVSSRRLPHQVVNVAEF